MLVEWFPTEIFVCTFLKNKAGLRGLNMSPEMLVRRIVWETASPWTLGGFVFNPLFKSLKPAIWNPLLWLVRCSEVRKGSNPLTSCVGSIIFMCAIKYDIVNAFSRKGGVELHLLSSSLSHLSTSPYMALLDSGSYNPMFFECCYPLFIVQPDIVVMTVYFRCSSHSISTSSYIL